MTSRKDWVFNEVEKDLGEKEIYVFDIQLKVNIRLCSIFHEGGYRSFILGESCLASLFRKEFDQTFLHYSNHAFLYINVLPTLLSSLSKCTFMHIDSNPAQKL